MTPHPVPNSSDVSPVVSMDMITKTFPGVKALDEVRLDLYPGQVTALVGENGAGKSTTVKILTGIYRPRWRHDPYRRRTCFPDHTERRV